MKKYEEFIKDYVEKNANVLNEKASSKKRLIKFSEAVSRAITESKKSDTGYGDLAESLASAGLSRSGYADFLRNRNSEINVETLKSAENEKMLGEAEDELDFRLENERLEQERLEEEAKEKVRLEKEEAKKLAAEEKEKQRLEKEEAKKLAAEEKAKEKLEKEKLAAEEKEKQRLEKIQKEIEKDKKAVLSYANSNAISDFDDLYNYGVILGLSEEDAKEAAERGSANVRQKLRTKSIEKTREVIISERLTKAQAYAYAKNLGLDDADAESLAEFAYKMNQDVNYIVGGS